jgi:hypothetical protein
MEVTFYFSRNPENERTPERPGQKYENNIKMDLKYIFVECRHNKFLNGVASALF